MEIIIPGKIFSILKWSLHFVTEGFVYVASDGMIMNSFCCIQLFFLLFLKHDTE